MRIIVSLMLAATLICCIFFILYSWKKRFLPGASYLILLNISVFWVNAGYIGELNSNYFSTAILWSDFEHVALPFVPYFWLLMCLDYTNKLNKKRIVEVLLLSFPLLYFFLYFSNNWLHLYIKEYYFKSNGYFPVISSQKAIGFIILIALITIIGFTCNLLYLAEYLKAPRLIRNSYQLMIIASLFPWLAIYLNIYNNSYLGIDYFSFAMLITGILYMFGIFRYNILSTIPIAAESVYRFSEDAIALTDMYGYIIDVNEKFTMYYPEYKNMSKKRKLKDFFDNHKEFIGINHKNENISFCREIRGSKKNFSTKLIPMMSNNNIFIGDILEIKDITIYVEYQNQLKVIAEKALVEAEVNEISFLQAQISPHFINNTLSAISSLISRDDEKAKTLVVDLSEYLIHCYRSQSSYMETLSYELEAVNAYIKVVKARFGTRIQYEVNIKAPLELKMPRLILQPIIENSVHHGLQPKSIGGTVSLAVETDEKFAYFKIKDDGIGIELARIGQLLEGKDNKQGVGIINIHKRLLKHYGKGLEIESKNGTEIRFQIPIER